MPLITAGAVVADGRVHRPGWLRTTGNRVSGCGPGVPDHPADATFPESTVVPGFVDMHVHGGGGASFADDPDSAAAFHRRHGTTGTLASLVTTAPGALRDTVAALAHPARRAVLAGIHLEGPWLSAARCGAHDAALLRGFDPAEIDALLSAGAGAIRMVTVAPELPGASDAIRRFVDAGVVVAVGHTDADYEQTRAAIDAGAAVGTHLFNAMRPLHHREPGPVLALLEDPRVVVELIADGVHLHPALVRQVIESTGPDRVAMVTDAIAATGCGDGVFRLGGLDIDVAAGVARLRGTAAGPGPIAGSTATMDQLFRAVVGLLGGADDAVLAASRMCSATPARALGLDDVGGLRPGLRANLVVLGRDLRVERVMVDGEWQVGA